jgi:hypothetical protein
MPLAAVRLVFAPGSEALDRALNERDSACAGAAQMAALHSGHAT